MRKVGIPFNPGIGVNPDLTGLASTLTAEYRLEGSTGAFTPITGVFTEDYAGFYSIPLTITTAGSYLIKFISTDTRVGNNEGYVEVSLSSIDDIQSAVDAAQLDITSIKTQVDLLDETKVNALSGDLASVATTVNDIKSLVNDVTSSVVLTGDQTTLVAGDSIVGTTSAANGTVQSVTFDGTNTTVVLSAQTGAFVATETFAVNGGVAGIATVVSASANAVNSVLEFVSQIDTALSAGGSSLSVLASYTDDLEAMLRGDAILPSTGSASPFSGKGLVATFDAIGANATSIANLDTHLGNVDTTLQNAVTAAKVAIQADIAAVKTVVDANSTVLTDAGYGLAAIKTAIDGVNTALAAHDTGILAVLNDATNGLAAIKTAIMDKLTIMDGKLDTISAAQTATVITRVVL